MTWKFPTGRVRVKLFPWRRIFRTAQAGGKDREVDLGQILSTRMRIKSAGMESIVQNTQAVKKTVVYACSGCSDAGELSDRIARGLARAGVAEMSCLAGIGGRVKPLMNQAAGAERILAIDGCPLNCARHTLELAGFQNFKHLELHQLGWRKHACPVTAENIEAGVQAAKEILSAGTTVKSPREFADQPS